MALAKLHDAPMVTPLREKFSCSCAERPDKAKDHSNPLETSFSTQSYETSKFCAVSPFVSSY
jgi:hypothetical protein